MHIIYIKFKQILKKENKNYERNLLYPLNILKDFKVNLNENQLQDLKIFSET